MGEGEGTGWTNREWMERRIGEGKGDERKQKEREHTIVIESKEGGDTFSC